MKKLVRIFLPFLFVLALGEAFDLAYLSYVRATITTTASAITIGGNGSTQVFTYNFVAGQASYIQVTYTNASGEATVVPASQYTLTINAAAPGQVWGVGGTVTYPTIASAQPPISSGTTLTIQRVVPLIQTVSSSGGQAFPLAVEQALDLLDMQIQQVSSTIKNAITAPLSDPSGLNYVLPPAAQRANQVLCFDNSGNVSACSTVPQGTVSSAMQPVVSAATLSAGRTAFGLGSMAVENINSGTQGGPSLQDDGSGNARVALTSVADSINQTVSCNYHLTQHIATGPITYTLPQASTCFNGFGFSVTVLASGGPVTITPFSTDSFAGGTSGGSIVIQPGTTAFITTNAASSATWYAQNGTLPISATSPATNLGLSASATSDALTLNVTTASGAAPTTTNPILVGFRSTTAANGSSNLAAITSTLSLTVPASATLGTSNNVPFRVWLFLAYNNGSPELVAATCSTVTQIYGCGAWDQSLTTTTTISSGATSAGVPYTVAGRSGDALRLIGYCSFDAGLPTAGQWTSSCSKLQVFGPGVKRPGEVVQEIFVNISTTSSTTSNALVASNVTGSITPSSAINLIDIDCTAPTVSSANNTGIQNLSAQIQRGSTALGQSETIGLTQGGLANFAAPLAFSILDAPGTTASTSYTLFFGTGASGHGVTINGGMLRLKEIMG